MKADYIYCSNCLKLIKKKDAKWVKKQIVSEENILLEEWNSLVCFQCYKKLSKEIKKDVIKQELIYFEEE